MRRMMWFHVTDVIEHGPVVAPQPAFMNILLIGNRHVEV